MSMMMFRSRPSLIQNASAASVATNSATVRRNPRRRASAHPSPQRRTSASEFITVSSWYPVVAERGGLFAVAPHDGLRVLDHFLRGLDGDGERKTPDLRQPRHDERQQPAEREAVEHVRGAIRVQQVLGVVRAPRVARPQKDVVARAYPQAPLAAELVDGASQHRDDGEPRQNPSHPGPQRTRRSSVPPAPDTAGSANLVTEPRETSSQARPGRPARTGAAPGAGLRRRYAWRRCGSRGW